MKPRWGKEEACKAMSPTSQLSYSRKFDGVAQQTLLFIGKEGPIAAQRSREVLAVSPCCEAAQFSTSV